MFHVYYLKLKNAAIGTNKTMFSFVNNEIKIHIIFDYILALFVEEQSSIHIENVLVRLNISSMVNQNVVALC